MHRIWYNPKDQSLERIQKIPDLLLNMQAEITLVPSHDSVFQMKCSKLSWLHPASDLGSIPEYTICHKS